MKEEFSASVCCWCDAVRMTVENGVDGADGAGGVGLGASKADLRGPRGSGREQVDSART